MLESIKEVFNMPTEENIMDKIVENKRPSIQEIAQGVRGIREKKVKEAQKEVSKCMDDLKLDAKHPERINPEKAQKAIEAENNLANATKRLEHAKLVATSEDLNNILEEVINEVSDEWVKNKLKNVSRSEMNKRIQKREEEAQKLRDEAKEPVRTIIGTDKRRIEGADKKEAQAGVLKDLKHYTKPSIIDKAKETISNFKSAGKEATNNVVNRAKEAIKNIGDSKVKDLGKSLKAEGKGVADSVKQGVKDTIKGTTKGSDDKGTTYSSAVEKARKFIDDKKAERKATEEEDKNERAKNMAKQQAEKEAKKADMQSRIEKAKAELEAQKKAKEDNDKKESKPAEVEDTKEADNKKTEEPKTAEVNNTKEETKAEEKTDDKKDDTKSTEATKVEDDKEKADNKTKKSSKAEDTGKGTKATNIANVSGNAEKGGININQTATASSQTGSKKGDKTEEIQPAEPTKTKSLRKKVKTTESPKEVTSEPVNAEGKDNKNGEEKPQEVKAEGEDSKPAEEEKNDKLKDIKVPKKFEKMSDDELRKELKRRQDVVLKANNAKLNPEIDSESALKKLSREDLLHSMFHKDSVKLYKEAEKKLTDASKSAPESSKESTPETPNAEGGEKPQEVNAETGDNKSAEVTGEQTSAGDKDKTPVADKVEKIRGKKNNTTEGEKGELTSDQENYMKKLDPAYKANMAKLFQDKNKRNANGKELYDFIKKSQDNKFDREMDLKTKEAEDKANLKAEKELQTKANNERASKNLVELEKAGFDVGRIRKEAEGENISDAELERRVLQDSENQVKTLNNSIDRIADQFSPEVKKIVFSNPQGVKNKIDEFKTKGIDRELIKGLPNTQLLQLVNDLVERNALEEKLKKFKK